MLNETESALVRALNIREKVLGPNHPSVGQILGNLAVLYCTQGRYLEAVSLTERSLAIVEMICVAAKSPTTPSTGPRSLPPEIGRLDRRTKWICI
jgi:hypothetical protein